MAYTTEQKKIASRIIRIGRKRGVPKKHIKAALETGIVESGLRNLSGGDADSAGWRQERASLYADPTNLKASINRYYDETKALDSGQGAGRLAADVQRPAAEYRGRYREVAGEARALLEGASGAIPSKPATAKPAKVPGKRTRVTNTPGKTVTSPDPAARKMALFQYLSAAQSDDPGALLGLASALRGATTTSTTPGQKVIRTTNAAKAAKDEGKDNGGKSGGKVPVGKKVPGSLAEMYHDPGINMDGGARVAPIGHHPSHVHFASENFKVIKAAAALAQEMGLHVGENPKWDPVDPVHTTGSYHYQRFAKRPGLGKAIDVSGGTPALLLAYNKRLARLYG